MSEELEAREIASEQAYVDEVYVQQIGPDKEGFFAAWEKDVFPQLR